MDKDSQELDLQLNNDAPDGESYSLEDIMREFGGWTKQEEEPAAEPEPEPEQPNEPEQPPQPEQPAAAPAFCPSCGVKSSGEKFCQNCGAPLR